MTTNVGAQKKEAAAAASAASAAVVHFGKTTVFKKQD